MLRSLALMTAPARAILMCSTATTLTSLPSKSKVEPTRKSLVDSIEVLHSQEIAARPEAGDDAGRGGGGDALLAEGADAREQVREMDLDDRHVDRSQAVHQRVRVVGEGGGVDHDADGSRPFPLEPVDELPFVVGLKEGDRPAQLGSAG